MALMKILMSVEYAGDKVKDMATIDEIGSGLIQARHDRNTRLLQKYNSFMEIMIEEAASRGDEDISSYAVSKMYNLTEAGNVVFDFAVKQIRKKYFGNS